MSKAYLELITTTREDAIMCRDFFVAKGCDSHIEAVVMGIYHVRATADKTVVRALLKWAKENDIYISNINTTLWRYEK